MIYWMGGKTFLKDYIKRNPKKVLNTQYVLVSSRIRKQTKYEKQVINMNNALFPSQSIIMSHNDYKHNDEYKREYFEYIEPSEGFFATLIKYAVKEDTDIVFLCAEKELKYRYLSMIADYIWEVFKYPVLDYKKYKKTKKIREYSKSYSLKRATKILKKLKKSQEEKVMQNEQTRGQFISRLKKKELKSRLKSMDLYVPGMTTHEMKETLDLFSN